MELKDYIRDVSDWPKKGVVFKDITPLLLNPEIFKSTIDCFYQRYKDKGIHKIVAVDSRGFIFGSVLAYKLEAPLVIARKEGKLPYETVKKSYKLEYGRSSLEIHKDAIRPKETVLLLDDVLASGGTAFAVAKLIESLGGVVLECAFLLELAHLGGKNLLEDYETFSILSYLN